MYTIYFIIKSYYFNVKISTQLLLAQSPKGSPHTLIHTTPSPSSPRQVGQVYKLGVFWSGYSQSNHHKQDF